MAILEEVGFQVLTAMHADDALQHLRENGHTITLLFTDVEMPGSLDGFGLARHTADTWPNVAIVVASGRRAPREGEMLGKATFIDKPFSVDRVHDHLHKVLPKDRQPEPLRQESSAATS